MAATCILACVPYFWVELKNKRTWPDGYRDRCFSSLLFFHYSYICVTPLCMAILCTRTLSMCRLTKISDSCLDLLSQEGSPIKKGILVKCHFLHPVWTNYLGYLWRRRACSMPHILGLKKKYRWQQRHPRQGGEPWQPRAPPLINLWSPLPSPAFSAIRGLVWGERVLMAAICQTGRNAHCARVATQVSPDFRSAWRRP